MKRLWVIISRVGTILFTIGFAFLILSLFAQTVYSPYGFNEQTISNQQFQPLGARYDSYSKAYRVNTQPLASAQNIYNLTINSNVTLNIYIIDMNITELAVNYQILPQQLSQANLENLLQTKSALILWQGSITNGSINYTPLRNSYFTILISNPTSEIAQIQYTISYYHMFVPRTAGLQTAAVSIPVGLVLATPMLSNTYKRVKNRFHRNKK